MKLVMTESADAEGNRTLVLVGSLDLITRQAFIDAGRAVLETDGGLTLDMSEVTFIDSTGIGALVELRRTALASGARLEVSGRSPRVERIFEATGLDGTWAPA